MLIVPEDAALDQAVRNVVYDQVMQTGAVPLAAAVAAALGQPLPAIQAAFARLAEAHMLALQRGSGEVLMAAPFSAVPTPFRVTSGDRAWYGNCIWDALGIPAMLGADAVVQTACGCCSTAMELVVRGGALTAEGIAHFAIPARRWWDNIVFS
jgi:hypothetical protein